MSCLPMMPAAACMSLCRQPCEQKCAQFTPILNKCLPACKPTCSPQCMSQAVMNPALVSSLQQLFPTVKKLVRPAATAAALQAADLPAMPNANGGSHSVLSFVDSPSYIGEPNQPQDYAPIRGSLPEEAMPPASLRGPLPEEAMVPPAFRGPLPEEAMPPAPFRGPAPGEAMPLVADPPSEAEQLDQYPPSTLPPESLRSVGPETQLPPSAADQAGPIVTSEAYQQSFGEPISSTYGREFMSEAGRDFMGGERGAHRGFMGRPQEDEDFWRRRFISKKRIDLKRYGTNQFSICTLQKNFPFRLNMASSNISHLPA
ncbi:unnamed protein product [Strongylus vulgaris]|uniref:Uncharacterized protein n=1 Tax=Strongylus vulgaris TaxID=40348 RepID=A0A3P7IJU1_STRVU|nr:unnamed protein product [Strongylus vulgaris]